MKSLAVSSMLKPKKKQQKKNEESNLAHFGHQSNKPAIVVKYDMNETMNRLKKNFLHSN